MQSSAVMSICDALELWELGNADERAEAVRDWIAGEASSWGMDTPNFELGKSIDADGNEHWSSYNRDTDTIKMDPALFDNPDDYPAEDVINSAAHEFRHAMQDQYGDDEIFNAQGEREADAKDFANAYSDYLEDECDSEDFESAPASDPGDWNLPPGGDAVA
jgi:hypothetical protein